MKILRSVTRRGFTVGTAGMFTIVSPNRWFAASQFRSGFQPLSDQFKKAASAAAAGKASDRGEGRETAAPQIMILSAHDRRPMRFALIASLAAAIALFILWWFFHTAVGWLD